MKQLPTRTIAIIALVAVAVLAIGVFAVQDHTKTPDPVLENGEDPEISPIEPSLVTDVDMNVENWQLIENSLYTIKVPKEWYWREGAALGILMTNDPEDSLSETGLFSILSATRFIQRNDQIIFGANSGPIDNAYDQEKQEMGVIEMSAVEFKQKKIIDYYEEEYGAKCGYVQQNSDPEQFVVECGGNLEMDGGRYRFINYSFVTEDGALYFSFVTTSDTLINEKVFDMMMQSVVLKYHDYQQ